jgi:hypothetical protein
MFGMTNPMSTLVAVGNLGRQLLLWRGSDLQPFRRCILLARPSIGAPPLPGVTVLSYRGDSIEACRKAEGMIGEDAAAIFGAAGGITTSMTLLRLARTLSAERPLHAVVVSPFSCEGRRRQWRALYVRFRLNSMRNVDLSVVVTGALERNVDEDASAYGLELAVLEHSWQMLVP